MHKTQKEIDVLILGHEDTGKSIMLENLKAINSERKKDIDKSAPTVGYDKQNFKIDSQQYSVAELGSPIFQNWMKFVPKAKSIIFMVNCDDPNQLA